MNYADIKTVDIQDGTGVRVSLYVSGCHFHCKGCHNPEAWNFEYGKKYNEEIENYILEQLGNSYISGLSILGGEPLHPKNIEGTKELAKAFREKFPNKDVWVWSGFQYDKELKDKEVLKYIDVLVDGQYVDALRDPRLKWKGSKNQRVIDVQQSLKDNEIRIYES